MAKGLGPILLLGAAAAIYFLGKKKKDEEKPERMPIPPPDEGPECPAEVPLIDMTTQEWDVQAKQAWENANGDPIRAADILFSKLVAVPCTKNDYKTIIKSESGIGAFFNGMNLSMFYAGTVSGVLEANIDMENPQEYEQARGVMRQVADWYLQTTGEIMPDID